MRGRDCCLPQEIERTPTGNIPRRDVYKRQVLEMAGEERNAGKQVLIANMKKNKKFQKEQLSSQGYTDITEIYKDSL